MKGRLWDINHPGIYIVTENAPHSYFHTACEALNKIRRGQIGAALLKSIAARSLMSDGKLKVIIKPDDKETLESSAKAHHGERALVQDNGKLKRTEEEKVFCDFVAGRGTSVTITWHHKHGERDESGVKIPAFIVLAHELVHAYHYIHGAAYRPGDDVLGREMDLQYHEEGRTVGIGPYEDEVFCENAIRREQQDLRRKKGKSLKDFFRPRQRYGDFNYKGETRALRG
jgi:hypothetical protein